MIKAAVGVADLIGAATRVHSPETLSKHLFGWKALELAIEADVDTGSKDETPQIVEEFGGRLFHFPWIDNFSAARNESLKHARGRWLFWMDSDDTIDEESGRRLHEVDVERSEVQYVFHFLNLGGNRTASAR